MSLSQTINDIKAFRVQGANQIAIYGLQFLKRFAIKNGFGPSFRRAANSLEKARPTAVVLHNTIQEIKKERSIRSIDSLIERIRTVSEKEATYADSIIKNGSTIITYCHSGEAMAFIKHAWSKHQKKISVIACLTEPLEQGVITARELSAKKIPVTLIDDNAIGYFIKDIDMAIVGADALRKEGVVNKIGTSLLAQAVKNTGKPFYVVANTLKIDRRENLQIEERPTKEIFRKISNKEGMKSVKIRNPAFDVTPWKYVTAIITEIGVFKSNKIRRLI